MRLLQKKYLASKKSKEFLNESFKYNEEKYNLQLVTSFEYNNAKNNLTEAETEFIQSRYDYIFKLKMLDFYMGKPLTF